MKKFFIVILCFYPLFTFAQTMCVRDRSLVISLDGNINGESSGRNIDESIWWVDYPYGRVYGEATMLSETEGLGQTVSGRYYGAGEYENRLINAEPGLDGLDADGNERKYCWCRMTHSAQSAWVLSGTNTTIKGCLSYCQNNMVDSRYYGTAVRKSIFGSVGL